jgi:hypothetical protein
MDSDSARGFALHPGDAGCGGAIHQSSVDAADVDRAGRRDVLESAKVSAPRVCSPNLFELPQILRQSVFLVRALPGTRRLFSEVIRVKGLAHAVAAVDRVKCFASRHGESVLWRTRGDGDRYIGVAESPRRPLPGILT